LGPQAHWSLDMIFIGSNNNIGFVLYVSRVCRKKPPSKKKKLRLPGKILRYLKKQPRGNPRQWDCMVLEDFTRSTGLNRLREGTPINLDGTNAHGSQGCDKRE